MDFDENQDKYLVTEPLGLDEDQQKYLVNKIEELHSNVRHITQLGMNWFAFFVTINYLTIGWLAKSPGQSVDKGIISTVALVFILQNSLGMVGIWMVQKAAKAGEAQVRTYENALLKADNSHQEVLKITTIPAKLYRLIALLLMGVLLSLALAWVGICRYYRMRPATPPASLAEPKPSAT